MNKKGILDLKNEEYKTTTKKKDNQEENQNPKHSMPQNGDLLYVMMVAATVK